MNSNRLDRDRLTESTTTEPTQIIYNQIPPQNINQIPNKTLEPIDCTLFQDHEVLPIQGASAQSNNIRKETNETVYLEKKNRSKSRSQINNETFECDSFLQNNTQFVSETDELLESAEYNEFMIQRRESFFQRKGRKGKQFKTQIRCVSSQLR